MNNLPFMAWIFIITGIIVAAGFILLYVQMKNRWERFIDWCYKQVTSNEAFIDHYVEGAKRLFPPLALIFLIFMFTMIASSIVMNVIALVRYNEPFFSFGDLWGIVKGCGQIPAWIFGESMFIFFSFFGGSKAETLNPEVLVPLYRIAYSVLGMALFWYFVPFDEWLSRLGLGIKDLKKIPADKKAKMVKRQRLIQVAGMIAMFFYIGSGQSSKFVGTMVPIPKNEGLERYISVLTTYKDNTLRAYMPQAYGEESTIDPLDRLARDLNKQPQSTEGETAPFPIGSLLLGLLLILVIIGLVAWRWFGWDPKSLPGQVKAVFAGAPKEDPINDAYSRLLTAKMPYEGWEDDRTTLIQGMKEGKVPDSKKQKAAFVHKAAAALFALGAANAPYKNWQQDLATVKELIQRGGPEEKIEWARQVAEAAELNFK